MPTKMQRYFLLGVLFLLLNTGLGSWGLTESSEARYAEIGREMFVSGDYLYPTLMGIRHFHKPPVTYYITAAGYGIFGVNEFGARFFLSVALILQIILIYKIAMLLFGEPKMALTAAVIYLSFPLVGVSARVLTTDCYLTTMVLGSLYFFIHHKLKGALFSLYAFYIFLGLGFLTKGPAALVPLGLFLLLWKIVRKEKIKISLHTILAALLFLLIGGSWFLAIGLDDPRFLDYFVREQILERAVAANDLNRAKPFFYYWPLLPLIGFPWIPFLAAHSLIRKKTDITTDKTARVFLLTATAIVLFYSLISSKLILYILPAFPFLALFAAYWLRGMGKRETRAYIWILAGLCFLLAAFLPVASMIPQLGFQWPPAIALSIALLGATLVLLIYARRAKHVTLLGLSAVFILGVYMTFPLYAANNPKAIKTVRPVMDYIKEAGLQKDRELVIYDFWVPSTAFYLEEEVITIRDGSKRINQEVKFEPDQHYKETYLDLKDNEDLRHIHNILKRKDLMFLVLKKDSLPNLIREHLDQYQNRHDFYRYRLYY